MAIIHLHGLLIFFYIFPMVFPAKSSNTESEALLKLKGSLTNATSLDSWKPGTEPCAENGKWVGVLCANGVVSGLRLGRLGLSGKIDIDALASLSGLRSVAFMLNAFSGPIPDFHRLGALRGLYISDNRFSGELPPDYFSRMEGLKKVWLSGNTFSGPVPSSLARLSNLMELHLENNQFSGTIPPLEQQSLVSVNFSNNNLEGEIPSGLSRFSANAFEGNPGLCGGSSARPCNPPAVTSKASDNSHRFGIILWVVGAFIVLLLLVAALICMMRRRRDETKATDDEKVKENVDNPLSASGSRKKDISLGRKGLGSGSHRVGSGRKGSRGAGDLQIVNDSRGLFGMVDLMKAAAEVLGNGALGSSYKATMDSGLTVVVKRIKEMNKMGRDTFDLEMRRLGSLKHKNVLTPLAYYYRKEDKLLVHEYQHQGSLLLLLHGDRGIAPNDLNWPHRLKIIQGIARGLHFLHSQLSTLDLPHGDLKSSNVLLSQDFEPLLADYGFFPLIDQSQAAQSLIAFKSPEAINHNQISPKSDVYFLGIIILEILTRKFPSQYSNNAQGGTDLVHWVRSAISDGREVELLDPEIANADNFIQEVKEVFHIGVACTVDEPDQRLDVREAVDRIEGVGVHARPDGITQLPNPNEGTRVFHVLPSLRDGYADFQSDGFQSRVVENYNGRSVRRQESDAHRSTIGDQSGRESFAFEIS